MKPFSLESSMLTMSGVFYPTGYMVLMFASKDDAMKAGQKLIDSGRGGESISLLTPEVIQSQIVRTVGGDDIPLPSAGTEGDTVRIYAEQASKGGHALMIHAPDGDDTEKIMKLLKGANITYGQKYRMLVIEDLV